MVYTERMVNRTLSRTRSAGQEALTTVAGEGHWEYQVDPPKSVEDEITQPDA